ncbi:MAG: hypothetical protein SFV22_14435 [Saprospiraceae bacterium]|nr:hypothetical protein [Saprospiraceae bacterium]
MSNRLIFLVGGIFLLCLFSFALRAQAPVITTVSSRWQNSFVEWDIFSSIRPEELEEGEEADEEYYGEMKLRWLNVRDDFSEWDYELGGQRGTIRQKWKDDPQQWELRSYTGVVITMRTTWNNDFKEWRVSDNAISLNIRSKWTNQLDEWELRDSQHGSFYLYTLRTRDPRDWAIDDRLSPDISEEMKLAMIFLAIFHSTPKM